MSLIGWWHGRKHNKHRAPHVTRVPPRFYEAMMDNGDPGQPNEALRRALQQRERIIRAKKSG